MAMLRVKVTPDDSPEYELEVQPRDVLLWEKSGRDRSFYTLGTNLRMLDVYALAYLTAKRTKQFDGPQELFDSSCDLELLKDDDEPDPTSLAH